MKVIVARTAGFCRGVRSAVNTAVDAARSGEGPLYTLGPVVHNPHVVEMLESLEVRSCRELPESGRVVIRAHGVPPAVHEELTRRGIEVVDATCPRVKAVHKIAKKKAEQGFLVVVLGDEGHAEVDGIVGWAGGNAVVVSGPEEVEKLPPADKVCLVAQTTQPRERFEKTAEALRKRYSRLPPENLVVADTICDATRNRQEEVRRLAKLAEAVVVVGGPESANTKRLYEVAKEEGVPAFLVDTENDLDREALKKFKTVALTAGASTPNWLIRRVHDELVQLGRDRGPLTWLVSGLRFLIMANLYVALGATALMFAAGKVQGFTPYLREFVVCFLFVFGIHTMTMLGDPRALALNVPMRAKNFLRHRRLWSAASLAAVAGAVALGFSLRPLSGLFLFLLSVVSLFYPVRFLGTGSGSVPRSLAEVPGSKDIFMALGWAALVVLFPLVDHPGRSEPLLATLAAFVMVTALVFVRALLRDFRDLQADRLIGRETLPIMLGVTRTRRLLYAALVLASLSMLAAAALHAVPARLGVFLLAAPAYAAACVPLFTREVILQGFRTEGIIDAVFLIAGLAALAAG